MFFFFFFFAMKLGQHELTHEPTQFNRAMRLKANRHGFSLNQRGLYAGVLRDPHDRQKKVCEGWCLDDQFMHGTFREGSIGFFFSQDISLRRRPRKRFSASWVRVLFLPCISIVEYCRCRCSVAGASRTR